MSDHFGTPGLGGSLGTCAVCAAPFVSEILFGKTVTNFKVTGIPQTLYAHTDKCVPLLKECAGDNWRNLPDASPIRKAFEEHEAKLEGKQS